MHTVVIEKVDSYSPALVQAGLLRLLEPLGGMAAFVKPGERVLIKPNMLSAKPPEAAVTTHPELLRAVIGAGAAGGRDRPGGRFPRFRHAALGCQALRHAAGD